MNKVIEFAHSRPTPPPSKTGRCNHQVLIQGSHLLTLHPRKTTVIPPTIAIGARRAEGVLSVHSFAKM